MKNLIFLITLAFVLPSNAVHLEEKKAPRSTAAADLVAEVLLLKNIVACVQKGKSVKEVHSCSESFFPAGMTKADRHRLLAWFEMPYNLSYPVRCSAEVTDFLSEEVKAKAKVILCSDYKKGPLDKKVLFFIGEQTGAPRLLNIQD